MPFSRGGSIPTGSDAKTLAAIKSMQPDHEVFQPTYDLAVGDIRKKVQSRLNEHKEHAKLLRETGHEDTALYYDARVSELEVLLSTTLK